jgi:hypothetical protein
MTVQVQVPVQIPVQMTVQVQVPVQITVQIQVPVQIPVQMTVQAQVPVQIPVPVPVQELNTNIYTLLLCFDGKFKTFFSVSEFKPNWMSSVEISCYICSILVNDSFNIHYVYIYIFIYLFICAHIE